MILANHGLLTVAKTVDAAAFLFGAFDRCIQAQLMADAAAGGRGTETLKATPEVAEYTRNLYTDEMTYIMFQSGEFSFYTSRESQKHGRESNDREAIRRTHQGSHLSSRYSDTTMSSPRYSH